MKGAVFMTEQEKQKLEQITKKLRALQSQKKDIISREKKRKQKEYETRLIQLGTLSEKYFSVHNIAPADYENFLRAFLPMNGIENCINFAKEKVKKVPQIKNPPLT